MKFQSRRDAGERLVEKLQKKWKRMDCLVFGLSGGGLFVAKEVAVGLKVPLLPLVVRRLGAPLNPELEVGAICENDPALLNHKAMKEHGVLEDHLVQAVYTEKLVIKDQIERLRSGEELPHLSKKMVILVDDGSSGRACLQAAVEHLQKKNAYRIILAIPVLARDFADHLRRLVEEVVILEEVDLLPSIAEWYERFEPVTEADAQELLDSVSHKVPTSRPKISHEEDFEELLQSLVTPLRKPQDLDELVMDLKDKRVVMLGESTHGTEEFYQIRRTLTQRLLRDHGFRFVAVEGDWPDTYRVNQFIQGKVQARSPKDLLLESRRWPTWMWANEEIVKLIEWMQGRDYGFYGLDVYSLFSSINRVLAYVQQHHPQMRELVERHYSCFQPFESDEISYARSLLHYPEGCEDEVVKNLQALLDLQVQGPQSQEALFEAQQNAHVIANAEAYYRAMMKGDENSWNIRDGHMMETLDRLLDRHGEGAKAIVWAHNTHIGDYRATDMKDHGYVNIGGLARKLYGEENVSLVGLGTYEGEVLASFSWGAPEQVMALPPAQEESYEALFHRVCQQRHTNYFHLKTQGQAEKDLMKLRNQRAVGVVYNPKQEYRSNYVPTELSKRYDHFLFVDRTHALRSLHVAPTPRQFPETWPSGQ